MIQVGLTGGIGSGKSTVARILETLGYPVFHSDEAAKRIMHEDKVMEQIISIFGPESYSNGQLNRKKIASEIFNDSSKRQELESLIHPLVRSAFQDFCILNSSKIIFNEAAILFETGAYKSFQKVIYVSAPMELRLKRVIQRDLVDREAVLARMAAQNSDEINSALADFVIKNDEKESLIRQVLSLINQLN